MIFLLIDCQLNPTFFASYYQFSCHHQLFLYFFLFYYFPLFLYLLSCISTDSSPPLSSPSQKVLDRYHTDILWYRMPITAHITAVQISCSFQVVFQSIHYSYIRHSLWKKILLATQPLYPEGNSLAQNSRADCECIKEHCFGSEDEWTNLLLPVCLLVRKRTTETTLPMPQ